MSSADFFPKNFPTVLRSIIFNIIYSLILVGKYKKVLNNIKIIEYNIYNTESDIIKELSRRRIFNKCIQIYYSSNELWIYT